MKVRSSLLSVFVFAAVCLPSLAWAAPGSTGLESFGSSVLDFMTTTLGPIVLGLGIAIAAYSLIFGNRDALQKALWVVVGGCLLFSVNSVVSWIQGAAS